jgi:hypothetical protein
MVWTMTRIYNLKVVCLKEFSFGLEAGLEVEGFGLEVERSGLEVAGLFDLAGNRITTWRLYVWMGLG